MVSVTEDTVAFCWSLTTIVTEVSSRNWLVSNQREDHDVEGFESIMLIARSGWSPSSLFHDRTCTEEITDVTESVGGGVVVRTGAGSAPDCWAVTPSRSDWPRSRLVTGRVAIHGPQIAPKRNRTTPKMSAGRVGSISFAERSGLELSSLDEAGAACAGAAGMGGRESMTSVGSSTGGAGIAESAIGCTRGIWCVAGASARGSGCG